MNQNNYLNVGDEYHCLYCHFTIKRAVEDPIEHFEKHKNSKAQMCNDLEHLLDCPDWAKNIK